MKEKKWFNIYTNLGAEAQKDLAKWIKEKCSSTKYEGLFFSLINKKRFDKSAPNYSDKELMKIWDEYHAPKYSSAKTEEEKVFKQDRLNKDVWELGEKMEDFLIENDKSETQEGAIRNIKLLKVYSDIDATEFMKKPLQDLEKQVASLDYYTKYQYLLYYQHYYRIQKDKGEEEAIQDKTQELTAAFHLYTLTNLLYTEIIVDSSQSNEHTRLSDLITPFLAENQAYTTDTLLSFYLLFLDNDKKGFTLEGLAKIFEALKANKIYILPYQLKNLWTKLQKASNKLVTQTREQSQDKRSLLWDLMRFSLEENLLYEGKTVLFTNYLNAIRTYLQYFDAKEPENHYWKLILALQKGLKEKDKKESDKYKMSKLLVNWKEKRYNMIVTDLPKHSHFSDKRLQLESKLLLLKAHFSIEMAKEASKRFGIESINPLSQEDLIDELADLYNSLDKLLKEEESLIKQSPRYQSFIHELTIWRLLLNVARSYCNDMGKSQKLKEKVERMLKELNNMRLEYDQQWYKNMLEQAKNEI